MNDWVMSGSVYERLKGLSVVKPREVAEEEKKQREEIWRRKGKTVPLASRCRVTECNLAMRS